MAIFRESDDLRGSTFTGTDLSGSRFTEADLGGCRFSEANLSGVVMRGVEVRDADIDAPWLADGGATFHINGIDVAGYVEAELDRRFPGRAQRRAADPEGLRAAWSLLQQTWAATMARAEAMSDGPADISAEISGGNSGDALVDVSVHGEWSFAQTLRHLVFATDLWLGRSVLGRELPFHPLGLVGGGPEQLGLDPSLFADRTPAYAEVVEARADRVAMVGDFLAAATAEELAAVRRNPWHGRAETTLSCLHVILREEWDHHRFAARDLDVLQAKAG
ncbi:DinB family protein [Yinghuangia soli]|uniref:Pentapeptide repeat-containing protein n=1 Tax=Yinghuangia soli TaxID=2908204 RepID=A0AA41U4D7_9ACTN|nr:DinB family protein [Yinghuangia soli]MCF2528944.1 pentapeptide repeat-containing protein [Yinghuangia soli]